MGPEASSLSVASLLVHGGGHSGLPSTASGLLPPHQQESWGGIPSQAPFSGALLSGVFRELRWGPRLVLPTLLRSPLASQPSDPYLTPSLLCLLSLLPPLTGVPGPLGGCLLLEGTEPAHCLFFPLLCLSVLRSMQCL